MEHSMTAVRLHRLPKTNRTRHNIPFELYFLLLRFRMVFVNSAARAYDFILPAASYYTNITLTWSIQSHSHTVRSDIREYTARRAKYTIQDVSTFLVASSACRAAAYSNVNINRNSLVTCLCSFVHFTSMHFEQIII